MQLGEPILRRGCVFELLDLGHDFFLISRREVRGVVMELGCVVGDLLNRDLHGGILSQRDINIYLIYLKLKISRQHLIIRLKPMVNK